MSEYPETSPLHRSDWLIIAALISAALLIFAVLFSQKFEGLRSNDQYDYSQIARNLSRGEGYTTKALKPLELSFDPRIHNHPDYWRAPLYPLMICAAYLLLGVRECGGVLVSGLFFILMAPMLYVFGRRVSGRMLGVSAALVAMFVPAMWDFSLNALSEMSFAFLILLMMYGMYRKANPFLIGILFGLCYLERYYTLIYLPAIIGYLGLVDNYGWRKLGLFGVGALLVMTPWLIRNLVLTGNPLFTLDQYEISMFTQRYPAYYEYTTFEPVSAVEMLRRFPDELLAKYERGLNYFIGEIPRLTQGIVMVFFVAGILLVRHSRRFRYLLYAVLVMMLIQLHFQAVIHPLIRLYVPYIPLIALFATAAFERLLRVVPAPRARMWITGGAVLALAATSAPEGWRIDYRTTGAVSREEAEHIAGLPADAVVATDQPFELAWRADVVSIWAPVEYEVFRRRLSDVRYVFFSGILFEPAGGDLYKTHYLGNPEFHAEFRLEREFRSGGRLFVLRAR